VEEEEGKAGSAWADSGWIPDSASTSHVLEGLEILPQQSITNTPAGLERKGSVNMQGW
jgi:hypothetical protein